MLVELTRVRVLPGKSQRVDEWLAMLNSRMDEVKKTLVREQMKVEVIFREVIGADEYLYWFSIQGEDGADVKTSPPPARPRSHRVSQRVYRPQLWRARRTGAGHHHPR